MADLKVFHPKLGHVLDSIRRADKTHVPLPFLLSKTMLQTKKVLLQESRASQGSPAVAS